MAVLESLYLALIISICILFIIWQIIYTSNKFKKEIRELSIGNDKLEMYILKKRIEHNTEKQNMFNIVAIYRSGDINKYFKEINFIYNNKGEQHRIQNHYTMLKHKHRRIN